VGPTPAGLRVERIGRDLERPGQCLDHGLRRFAQAPLDLRQVRVRDAGKAGRLTQRQLLQLPLPTDEAAQRDDPAGPPILIDGLPRTAEQARTLTDLVKAEAAA